MIEDFIKLPQMKTINEVAELAGLSKYCIRKMVLNDKVRYIKTGNKYLINLDSLKEYMATGEIAIKNSESTHKIRKVGD